MIRQISVSAALKNREIGLPPLGLPDLAGLRAVALPADGFAPGAARRGATRFFRGGLALLICNYACLPWIGFENIFNLLPRAEAVFHHLRRDTAELCQGRLAVFPVAAATICNDGTGVLVQGMPKKYAVI